MAMLTYILPILILVNGIIMVFLDFRKTAQLIMIAVLCVISLGLLTTQIIVTGNIHDDMTELEDSLSYEQYWKRKQIAKLNGIASWNREQNNSYAQYITELVQFGWTPNSIAFKNSFEADESRTRVIENLPEEIVVAKPAVINNLPEDVDRVMVREALEELGFSVAISEEEAQAIDALNAEMDELLALGDDPEILEAEEEQEQATTTEEEFTPLESANVMYYGRRIKDFEIRLAALTLLRAGSNIKVVRSFKKKTRNNSRQIEFGWQKIYEKRPPLSASAIENKKSFRR